MPIVVFLERKYGVNIGVSELRLLEDGLSTYPQLESHAFKQNDRGSVLSKFKKGN